MYQSPNMKDPTKPSIRHRSGLQDGWHLRRRPGFSYNTEVLGKKSSCPGGWADIIGPGVLQ